MNRLRFGGVLAVAALAAVVLAQEKTDKPVAEKPAEKIAAPNPEAAALDKAIIAEVKGHNELMKNLGYLSDIIGPRLTGSPALKRANEWTADRMRGYGLTNVRLEKYEIPVGWKRGTATARLVEPSEGRNLLLASAGWSPSTKGKVVGDVVLVKAQTMKELEAYKGKLKNAIVLSGPPANVGPVNAPQQPYGAGPGGGGPGGRRGGPQGQGQPPAGAQPPQGAQPPAGAQPPGGRPGGFDRGNFESMMTFRRERNEFLRSEGVAVMLTDSGKPHGLLVTTGSWRSTDRDRVSATEPIPSAYMAHEHYALLYRLVTRPTPTPTRVEIEITNEFVPGPVAVYNTVGEIEGSEKPDEFVVVGAHLDSWDLAQGTTDNGTGSSVVLEAARALARSGSRPRRTIRFVLFTGEEQGLHGSRAYVQQHKAEMPKTSLCIVHDTGTGKVVGIGLQGREVLKPIMDRELTSLKELGVTDIDLRSLSGTDHQSFEAAGIPGIAFRQDPDEYRFTHHTQSDTFDKAKEPNLVQGAQVMALTAMRVANLPELLPRDRPERTGGFGGFRKGGEKKAPEKKDEANKQ